MVEHATFAAARAAVAGTERLLVAVFCDDRLDLDRLMLGNWHDASLRQRLDECSEWVVYHRAADFAEVKRDLHLWWSPAAVAQRGEGEVGRLEGCCDAATMLEWIDAVAAGRWRPLDPRERRRRHADGTLRLSPLQRNHLAKELVEAGMFDDAAELYEQLWATMAIEEPAAIGVRGSFLVGDMQELAQRHEPARRRFAALRDTLEQDLLGLAKGTRAAIAARNDWVLLNQVVADGVRTLAWFDAARLDPAEAPVITRNASELEQLLLAADRWADLGALIGDATQRVARDQAYEVAERRAIGKRFTHLPSQRAFARLVIDRRRKQFAILHAAMLGARRADDAAWVRAEALRAEDSAAMRRVLGRYAARARRSLRGT